MDQAKNKLIEAIKQMEIVIAEEQAKKFYSEEAKKKGIIVSNFDQVFERMQKGKENDALRLYYMLEDTIRFLGGRGITPKYMTIEQVEYRPTHPFFCLFNVIEDIFESCQLSAKEKTNFLFFFAEKI